MPRLFIAIPVDEETRAVLDLAIDELAAIAPRVHWVRAANLHATLKFLGEVPARDLDELARALVEAMRPLTPFCVEVEGLGAFPHARSPRAVWAGMGEGASDLADVARAVEAACVGLGYDAEPRPYTPHITLGRARHPADAYDLCGLLAEGKVERYGALDVDEVVVYMSERRRGESVYSPMFRARLGG